MNLNTRIEKNNINLQPDAFKSTSCDVDRTKSLNMQVLKFNGAAITGVSHIRTMMQLVAQHTKEDRLIIIVAAFKGITDQLFEASTLASLGNESYRDVVGDIEKNHLGLIKELISIHEQSGILSHCKRLINQVETLLDGCYLVSEVSDRTLDTIMGFGELLSSYIIFEVLKRQYIDTIYKDTRELIKTDRHFGKAVVNFTLTNALIEEFFLANKHHITVIPGFIASSVDGSNTTLGRGGSDYTASIFVSALNIAQLNIYTDFGGMYTADTNLVHQARPIEHLSYKEAMELLHFGAKELYPPSIQPLLNKNIPIYMQSIFDPQIKTCISNEMHNGTPVKGISYINKIALLTVEGSGMIGISGSSKRIFDALSIEGINVIFITQASSEHSICLGIKENDVDRAGAAINEAFGLEISQEKIHPSIVEKDLCIIALVGDHMRNHQGISGKMFSTLGRNNVNIRAIAQGASERNISVVIEAKDIKKALNSLHEQFFEDDIKQLNLFVMGVGNVGRIFLEQIYKQQEYLRKNLRLDVRLIALANSQNMYFAENGISEESMNNLSEGEVSNIDLFVEKVKKLNKRNSIFVDNTASEDVATRYADFLKSNIAVVTCNKIACSSSFENYSMLKKMSRKYNAPFLFETNVGAGLPIIDTLKNLVASGDKINKIEAVLSGSLNFIFNNFRIGSSFYRIVEQAGTEGYTEPDPRIDLCGTDVMRKLVILVRESGYKMEIDEIENISFLPNDCLKASSINDFFIFLKKQDDHFNKLLMHAEANNCKLKYVASFENGKARVGLQEVSKDHPFYNLEGKDNIVLFFTERYSDQPLQIRGAGAGASVTAAGIFADVIRVNAL